MGACASSAPVGTQDEIKTTKGVEKQLMEAERAEADIIQLLLLGTGGSGKTTFLKQMRILHASFLENEQSKLDWVQIIRENVFSNMALLCNQITEQGIPVPTEFEEIHKKASLHLLEDLNDLVKLSGSECVQAVLKTKNTFGHETNLMHFHDRVDVIAADDYCPSVADILAARKMTVGIVETLMVIDDQKLNIIDVGGQRNQRRKWISMFEGVTALIFLTALSEYNEKLAEDPTTDAMRESLSVFKSILRTKYFMTTPVILFLNKADLFAEKIKDINIGQFFASAPQGDRGCDYDSALNFIKDKFMSMNSNSDRSVYCHVTIATDTENVRKVFNACKHIIMIKSLKNVGL